MGTIAPPAFRIPRHTDDVSKLRLRTDPHAHQAEWRASSAVATWLALSVQLPRSERRLRRSGRRSGFPPPVFSNSS